MEKSKACRSGANEPKTTNVEEFLRRLADAFAAGQEHTGKVLENHAERITAAMDAIDTLEQLVNRQNEAINAQREVIAQLFEQLNPPAGGDSADPSVN